MGRLTALDVGHGLALAEFLADFGSPATPIPAYFCDHDWDVVRCAATLRAWSTGSQLESGFVPNSTWFWEEEDGSFSGVINVRHRLTDRLRQTGGHIGYSVAPSRRRRGVATRMLAAVLPECATLGIDSALITCGASNVGSWRAVEANGGVLQREAEQVYRGEQRLQRWYRVPTRAKPEPQAT